MRGYTPRYVAIRALAAFSAQVGGRSVRTMNPVSAGVRPESLHGASGWANWRVEIGRLRCPFRDGSLGFGGGVVGPHESILG